MQTRDLQGKSLEGFFKFLKMNPILFSDRLAKIPQSAGWPLRGSIRQFLMGILALPLNQEKQFLLYRRLTGFTLSPNSFRVF